MRELFYSEFTSTYGNQWKVQIYDSTLSPGGILLELTAEGEGFTLEHDAGYQDNKLNPIHTSKLDFYVYNEPNISSNKLDAFLINLRTKEEGTYLIKVSKYNGASYDLYWCGYLLQDFGGWDDTDRESITLSATDGLGQLKEIELDTATLEGYNQYAIINYALKQLTTADFWGASDEFVRIKTNWEDGRINVNRILGGLEDSMVYTKTDLDIFVDLTEFTGYDGVKVTERNEKSYFDVIYDILYGWNCELKLIGGVWRIYQKELLESSVSYRSYKKDETVYGSGTDTIVKTLDTSNHVRSNINFGYMPAIYQFRRRFIQKDNGNLFPYSGSENTYYEVRQVLAGSNRVRWTASYLIKNILKSTAGNEYLTPVFGVYFKIVPTAGSTYYWNGSAWTTSASYQEVNGDIFEIAINDKKDSSVSWDILTANIPIDGELSLKYDLIKFIDRNGNIVTIADYDLWIINNKSVYITDNQSEADYIEFRSTNPDAYSLIIEMDDGLFGSDGLFNGKSKMLTTNGTVFSYSFDSWGVIGGTLNKDFNELLVRQVMRQHNHANLILSGDILAFSFIDAQNTIQINYNSVNYKLIPNRVKYSANSDTLSGDWVECAYDDGIATTATRNDYVRYTPIDIINNVIQSHNDSIWSIFELFDYNNNFATINIVKPENEITSNTTLTESDSANWHKVNTSAGNVTVTLPKISTLTYAVTFEITFINDSNVLTILPDATDDILGEASLIPVLNETWMLRADLVNETWRVV